MKKEKKLIYSFFAVITILFFLDIGLKNSEFSDIENRFLQKKPDFNIDDMLNGKYFSNYDKYINDHFIFRDKFINLKSIIEKIQFKKENNGIIYGQDGYMFEKVMNLNDEILEKNIAALDIFFEKYYNAKLMVVPYSYTILRDYYSENLIALDEKKYINMIYEKIGESKTIDVVTSLEENKNEYIYYKTDHHWTTYGAYLAYKEYCKKIKDNNILSLDSLEENNISNFKGTFYSKSKLINTKSDILTYYNMQNLKMKINNNNEFESIYNLDNLFKRDKYSVFLDGNHSKITILNDNNRNGKKLFIIKDSFANSMVPFVANNYEETIIVDLRYFQENISTFLRENMFDDILVLYSFETLQNDKTIIKMKF
ncbi:MAG: DHHW family protein [Sarcina sp.]